MEQIEPILAAFGPDCRPRLSQFLGAAGGFSGAALWRLSTERGELCLRRWPREHPPAPRLRWIHELLRHVAAAGLPVPTPLTTVTGVTFVEHAGQLWELTPWLPGAADYVKTPSRARLEAAMRSLAKFHRVAESLPGEAVPRARSTGLTQRRDILARACAGRARLAAALADGDWPQLAVRGRRWLEHLACHEAPLAADLANVAEMTLPVQPCLADIWHAHVLFEGERVTGLVDFGAARIDNVSGDVSRLLGSLDLAEGDWSAGLAAYESIRPLADDERWLTTVFDRANMLLGPWNWLSWIVLEHRQFEDRVAVLARVDACLNRLPRRAVENV